MSLANGVKAEVRWVKETAQRVAGTMQPATLPVSFRE